MVPGRSGVLNIPSIPATPRIIARTKDCPPGGHAALMVGSAALHRACAGGAASACMLLHAIVSLTVKQQQELHFCSSCVLRDLSLRSNKWHWSGQRVIAPAGMNQGLASPCRLNAPVAQWAPEMQLWAGCLLLPVLLG